MKKCVTKNVVDGRPLRAAGRVYVWGRKEGERERSWLIVCFESVLQEREELGEREECVRERRMGWRED